MKVEYLREGSPDCPLIRIYGTEARDFIDLHRQLMELAFGTREVVNLDTVLRLMVGGADHAPRSVGHGFEWSRTRQSWEDLAALVEPLTRLHASGYQWLFGSQELRILVSRSGDGQW